jgi:hypothetical protein
LENKNFLADFKPEKVLKRVAEACLVIFADLKRGVGWEFADDKKPGASCRGRDDRENFLSGPMA